LAAQRQGPIQHDSTTIHISRHIHQSMLSHTMCYGFRVLNFAVCITHFMCHMWVLCCSACPTVGTHDQPDPNQSVWQCTALHLLLCAKPILFFIMRPCQPSHKNNIFVTATMFQNVSNPHDNPSDRYDINNNFAHIMSVVGFCALVLLCGSVQFTSEV
jgi:hypothetical protein